MWILLGNHPEQQFLSQNALIISQIYLFTEKSSKSTIVIRRNKSLAAAIELATPMANFQKEKKEFVPSSVNQRKHLKAEQEGDQTKQSRLITYEDKDIRSKPRRRLIEKKKEVKKMTNAEHGKSPTKNKNFQSTRGSTHAPDLLSIVRLSA